MAIPTPHEPILPRAVASGARVALVAPAGPLAEGAVDRAMARVREWGWEPVPGPHARGRHGYLAGTDDERLSDLQAAVDSTANDLIWCLRGGYGTMRILDRIDWTSMLQRPRPLIGFSDNTALHLALRRHGVVSFHGPHPATEEFPDFSLSHLRRLIGRAEAAGVLEGRGETLVGGTAEGQLVGGNLALLAATLGTPWALRAAGAILFFEEVAEAPYRIDRLLTQLRLAGALEGVRGIAVGTLTECGEQPEAVLRDLLGGLGVPVVTGFPFGHQPMNWTLPLGVHARLDAEAGTLEVLEPAVAA